MRKIFLVLALTIGLSSLGLSFNTFAGTLLVLGDSLSAGYGIAREAAWPNLLQQRLQTQGYPYTVVNASISGETSAGGRSRLPALLEEHRPRIVIIELGANDGLRGLPIGELQDNLSAMIRASRASGARVMLIGMRLPPNFGLRYIQQFADTFKTLAKQHDTALLPFLFDGFARQRDAFQPDGLHPTAATQPLMLDNVWPELKSILKKSGA